MSVLDKDTNNLSLLNTIEKITIPMDKDKLTEINKKNVAGFLFQFEFQVVSRFIRKSKGPIVFDYKVSIINPGGKTISNSEKKIAVEEKSKNLRVRTNFNSLPVNESGDYIINVEAKEIDTDQYDTLAEIPLEIVINTISRTK